MERFPAIQFYRTCSGFFLLPVRECAERLHPLANPGAAKTLDYSTEKSRSLVKERCPWAELPSRPETLDPASEAHCKDRNVLPEADLAS